MNHSRRSGKGQPPHSMGRRKNSSYIPYVQARSVVQLEHIQSRSQYWKWWDYYQPAELPRNPDWVYDEWSGWPSFLGTHNKFKNANPHQYLSHDDCLTYARSTQISTAQEWFDYGNHPSNVPVRPDLVYKGKFMGWNYFLGTGKHKTAAKVEEARKLEETQLLLFALPLGNAANQIHISVHPNVEVAKKFLDRSRHQFIKAFKLEPGYDWKRVVASHGTDYGEGEWLVNNVNQLLFDIDLEWVR